MRPWLVLTWGGITFEERVIPLGGVGYGKSKIGEILAVSPSGRVPALHVDDVVIWDSLAISEWAAERAPALWPADPQVRAVARSATAEMHSGFAALRRDGAMNVRRRAGRRDWPEDTRADIARVEELWGALRAAHGAGGPYLFGARSIADAFFAPVCTRLRTYDVPVGAVAQAYCETVFADDAFRAWEAAAVAEPWAIPSTDSL
ncbi:MAG: glutathione S-transferase [Hyphomonadaceae bacterium]|nr:glutathione S-transferase [Hyphomonadaceae bacterium]